ncbi:MULTISPECIES: EscU/YscU/HrcU family type III secretion system export apparatus switch protein [Variovorax]|uniref:EscU/YscU/HrcU family type III secretion system export apparatus switch protein n=1 Tax=Variovorax TaxID=34072 RepID=UPI0028621905|nr:EscU/YscU/HrcU family type III secretion system export apparatus switch protein [Variovorax sp. 3319]MDR6890156.1 flagellar biosynthesis protein [Variovorax sp. 3319]
MTALPDTRPSAVALSYADQGRAPVVVAKGYGVTAESILRQARENGVYVHASADLIRLLMQIDLDRQIPPQLYLAVAEVMAWIHGIEAGEGATGLEKVNALSLTSRKK